MFAERLGTVLSSNYHAGVIARLAAMPEAYSRSPVQRPERRTFDLAAAKERAARGDYCVGYLLWLLTQPRPPRQPRTEPPAWAVRLMAEGRKKDVKRIAKEGEPS